MVQVLTPDGQRIDGFLAYYMGSDGNAVPATSLGGNGSGGGGVAPAGMSPAVLQPGSELSDTPTPIVTATSKTVITQAIFSNTTDTDILFVVHRVPSGGAPATANQIITSAVIARSTNYANELAGMVLDPGDTIQAMAGAPGVNVFVSGAS